MNNYKVTCCSTVDLSRELMETKQIPFAKFHYHLNEQDYTDDLYSSISPDTFYQMILDGAQPRTSQINAEEYCALFEPFLKQGLDILHLTLSSGISGTINSANTAKIQLEEKYPQQKIVIVDSLGASSGYGMLVLQALNNQNQGMSLLENATWLEENKLRVQHWFFSTDLTSYIRGGRISKTAGFVGQVLDICPLLNVNCEGRLIPRTKHRGKKRVIRAMLSEMEKFAQDGADYSGKCMISHSFCPSDAEELAKLVEERFPKLDGKVCINHIGAVIGSHTGPGTVALFFWGKEREL